MKTSDFDYSLPPELIAQVPPAERGTSRMMVLRRATGAAAFAVRKSYICYILTYCVCFRNCQQH